MALCTVVASGGCFISQPSVKYEFDVIINGSQRLTKFRSYNYGGFVAQNYILRINGTMLRFH